MGRRNVALLLLHLCENCFLGVGSGDIHARWDKPDNATSATEAAHGTNAL